MSSCSTDSGNTVGEYCVKVGACSQKMAGDSKVARQARGGARGGARHVLWGKIEDFNNDLCVTPPRPFANTQACNRLSASLYKQKKISPEHCHPESNEYKYTTLGRG